MDSHQTPQAVTDLPPLRVPPRYNIATDLIDRNTAAGRALQPAIECDGRTLTYADVGALVNRAGNALRALGIVREQRVMLALPDSPELAASYLAAMKVGTVSVPCNTFLGAAEYRYFLRETRAPVLVTSRELYARIEPVLSDAPDLRTVILVDQDEDTPRTRAWGRWIAAASPQLEGADTSKDEPSFWLWTSGSTGEPKAAVHLHQDWAWCCHLYARGVLGMTAADRTFSAAKLFHAYGLGNGLVFPFWVGATTVLFPGRAAPERVFATIHNARPTIFFAVPTIYAAMLALEGVEQRFDLSSVRFCVSAGEPLPAELFRQWQARFGTEILDGIGSTEVLHIYISSRAGRVKPGSTGQPVPQYEVKVVDTNGDALGPDQVGDLVVKGPSTAIMYWNRRDQTRQKIRGEWFASGDKYAFDKDGYFWYAGRTDDMFKVGGEWISPIEIECAIIEHHAVLECAVVPYRDVRGVLKPKAYVVLKPGVAGNDSLVDEIQAFVRARAAHHKCPRAIEFVAGLPKTAAGKIQRFKLRAL